MSPLKLMLAACCLSALCACTTPLPQAPTPLPFPVPPASLMAPPQALHALKWPQTSPTTSASPARPPQS